MVRMIVDVPEEALAALRKDAAGFARELPVAAAVKWYELRLISQGRAALIAGLSRADFLEALSRYAVSPFQYSADEIAEEAERE
jgi:predicted HTH domain antitoxin